MEKNARKSCPFQIVQKEMEEGKRRHETEYRRESGVPFYDDPFSFPFYLPVSPPYLPRLQYNSEKRTSRNACEVSLGASLEREECE